MAKELRTRVLGRRLHLRRVTGWVRGGEGAPEGGFSLDTGSRHLPVRAPDAVPREGQRLTLVAAYRGGRRAWTLWHDPGSGHHGWMDRPLVLVRRLGLAWRFGTVADLAVAAVLVWTVAVRSLRFPALYDGAAALLGEGPVEAVLGAVFGLFHGIDRLLVRLEWMRAYDRVFDYPVWLGAGVVLAYAAVKLALVGLSLLYAALRLRRSARRLVGAAR
ncbi:MAG: hypothetical protein ACLFRB_04040 [Thiohalorhabdus sp.]|uniref:hypothetical protein n=1 Tax=Thiohalorhabdus sp. TaxID=3094134 RepID=UPI00397ED113